MFRKILVPLSGSAYSESVLPYVVELARLPGARAVLLHVLEPPPRIHTGPAGWTLFFRSGVRQAARDEALRYLGTVREKLREKELEAELLVAHGPVADAIVQTAKEINADVVAMASCRRSWISRFLRGSVPAATYDRMDRGCLLLVRAGVSRGGGNPGPVG